MAKKIAGMSDKEKKAKLKGKAEAGRARAAGNKASKEIGMTKSERRGALGDRTKSGAKFGGAKLFGKDSPNAAVYIGPRSKSTGGRKG